MMNRRFNTPRWALLFLFASGNGFAALDEATEALASNNYAAALQRLEEIPDEQRANPQWQLLYAAAEAGKGDLQQAEERYRALIAENPQRPEPYNNLAALYARQGKLDEAMELLEQAMKTNSSYATVYANLRSIYYEMSRSAYARALQMEQRKEGDGPALRPILSVTNPPTKPVVAAAAQQVTVAEASPEPAAATQTADAAPPEVVNDALVAVNGVAEPPLPAPESAPAVAATPIPAPEPAPTAAAKPLPAPEPAPTAAAKPLPAPSEDEVIAMLNNWAADWMSQRVDAYLAAYADDFQPGQGLSYQQWQAQRRKRLSRPESIEVLLGDFEVQFSSNDQARVTAVQYYRSDRYSDTVRKRFQLLLTPDGWKILTEKTIEVL